MARTQWLQCEHPEHIAGWHSLKGPLRELARHHGMSRHWCPRWATNQYRERLSSGLWVYWAEPLRDFDAETFADIAHLRANGYRVRLISFARRHTEDGPSICITNQPTQWKDFSRV